ncbi:hypothetical protein BJ912DRAFT_1141524 [Pholiota molesta]|nr:hypothetical protein BJ912DRAFT_1141524 [Pholiota molesta]
MSTSGHPGDAPNIRYIPAESKTVAEIKINAKDDISKEARGFAAATLIKTARAQMLAAKDQEGKGNLRAAFASYIKAATLTKMALDSPEYVQEAKDKGTLIRMELDDFLKNDGRNISGQATAVEEKLKAIEKAQTAGSTVVLPPAPNVVKSPSTSASKGSSPAAPPASTGSKIYSVSNFPVKTVVCREWKKDGKCKYGHRCRFSHAIQIQTPTLANESVQSTSSVQSNSGTPPVNPQGKKGKSRVNDGQKQAAQQKRAEEERLAKEILDRENGETRAKAEAEEKQKKEKAEREERERREAAARTIQEAAERRREEEIQRQDRERKEAEERERKTAEERERKAAEERERKAAEARERRAAEARAMREAVERERKEEAQRQEREKGSRGERKTGGRSKRTTRGEGKKEEGRSPTKERTTKGARRSKEETRAGGRTSQAEERGKARERKGCQRSGAPGANEGSPRKGGRRHRTVHRLRIQPHDMFCGHEYPTRRQRIRAVSDHDQNLPNDTKLEEIADIFTQQGVDSSEFFILQLRPNGGKREAEVLANVDQGQNIAIGLEGIEFRNEHLSFAVSENASWNGMATAAQNMPFLTVSWWAPSETVLATYDSAERAQRQVQRLNGKTWNGRRIRAMLNDRPNGARGFANFAATEIKILGCAPGTAHSAEFYTFVETFNVRLLNAANYDLDEIFALVRQHLRYLPGVQMDSYEVLNNGNQLDAEARIKIGFNDWEDAKRAHDTMDKKRLRAMNFPVLRSWLPRPLLYSIKVSRQQYQAQKSQWDELSEKKPGRDAHVHTRVGDRGDVFIRVLGQEKKLAGSLKVRVEGMVAGEKLDATYWHPSFGSPRGKTFLNRVLDEKKVYVRSDFKTRCLRVCGEPARVEEAKQMIREEVERLAGMETTRILDGACVRGFMREGLGKLKELIGEDNVAVNVASVPYKVTVKGGVEATHHLQRLMDESRAMHAPDNTLPGDAEREICPICTDDVSNPEQLGCGHTYCSGCLSHFLTSAADSKNFPLACIGNGGQCRVPIAIPFIRRFLPQQLFENLVEAAFMAYLEQHPQELKYCTTPDCKQIYRRRTDKVLLKCPACFSTICPMCDEEAHEGMTCEERKIHRDPGLQERLNDELARQQGFKKCPQCSVFIEKTEGCNHMTCKCGAHICWICLRLFTADTVYQHINTAHEGHLYDAIPGGANRGNADVDEDALMAAQIREIERFERERRAFDALRARVPQPIPQPIPRAHVFAGYQPAVNGLPAWQLGARGVQQQQPAPAQEAAQRREEQAQAERRRREALIREAERARVEEVTREYRERVARVQAAAQERERVAAEQRHRREEGGWCVVM